MSSRSPRPSDDRGCGGESQDDIRMTITLSNPKAGQELLYHLANATGDAEFTVECVSEDGAVPCTVDVESITQKRLETARLAVEKGYYDVPRKSTLSELAEIQGVTESAVSQKLVAVERQLVTALVESCS